LERFGDGIDFDHRFMIAISHVEQVGHAGDTVLGSIFVCLPG
jgi:hypothetical protein